MKIYLPINKMITFMKKTHTQVNNSKIKTKLTQNIIMLIKVLMLINSIKIKHAFP